MASAHLSLLLFTLFFFLYSTSTNATLHRISNLLKSQLVSQPIDVQETRYFEVTKPIKVPKIKPCSSLILRHDFGYTYGKPPVLAHYSPPAHCPFQDLSKIVLEWTATCKGRQFDRIFGVWLGGVELLRSCTAEPRATGIVWTVKKDVTRYYSLLMKEGTLAVYLGNLVDKTYTGIYHVNVSFHFYPAVKNSEKLNSGYGSMADLILPISRNRPLNDGLWFEIENATDVEEKEFKIPQNVYKAVLEVYLSFHENDEFWYSNPPNDYIIANNITDLAGNGPFREVLVSLDGKLVGAVWPFTVIYTGGINPLLWRPITGIGSFDLPSYDIELTPFLGKILDGRTHTFGFSVTNALNVWYIDANLHVWLDGKSRRTQGKLLGHGSGSSFSSSTLYMKGFNASFLTQSSRSISSSGWVKSSHGKMTIQSIQEFKYTNLMVMGNYANFQTLNQTIDFSDGVYTKFPSSLSCSIKSAKLFPLSMYSNYVDQGNETYVAVANITTGFNEERSKLVGSRFSKTSLENLEMGQGSMVVKDHLVSSGLGSTQQVYNYGSPKFCYFRNVSSSNYTILYDKVSNSCSRRPRSQLGFGLGKFSSVPARKVFLTSDLQDDEKGV